MAYGCHEERYPLPIAAVDTHRPKPAEGRKEYHGAASAAQPEGLVGHRASIARDYFGKAGLDPTGAVTPGGVEEALQKVGEAGETTPKAPAAAIS